MSFLENRTTAWCLTAFIILVSIFAGSGNSLGKLRAEAEDVFFRGADLDNMGILYDTERIAAECSNLITVASRYMQESDPAIKRLQENRQALLSAVGPGESGIALVNVLASEEALYQAMELLPLNEQDERFRSSLHTNINSHHRIIAASPYNRLAQEFNQTLRKQPAKLLGALTGIEPLELFE